MVRRALGRGLDALLPGSHEDDEGKILLLPVSEIRPNPLQPRRELSEEGLEELASSIREKGVLQPILVRRVGENYELVAGERRWRACQKVGLDRVPGQVVELSDDEAFEVAIIENLQREDLTPLEEARAYRALMERTGDTQEAVAKRVGKSRAQIANMIRLLGLTEEVQKMLADGEISVAHGKVLAGLASEQLQTNLARACRNDGLNVRALEARIQRGERKKTSKERSNSPYRDVEEMLRETLRTKVSIVGRAGRGTVSIEFYDSDCLNRLVELLTEGNG